MVEKSGYRIYNFKDYNEGCWIGVGDVFAGRVFGRKFGFV